MGLPEIVISIVVALLASGGFWTFLISREKSVRAHSKLLIGLAHDRIIILGGAYIERGWITKDEYEYFVKFLYEPYLELGGNGIGKKIMNEIDKLPMKTRVINLTEE